MKHLRHVAGAVFGYEAAAIFSGGRLPTITALCNKHGWPAYVAIGALVLHLYEQEISSCLSSLRTTPARSATPLAATWRPRPGRLPAGSAAQRSPSPRAS